MSKWLERKCRFNAGMRIRGDTNLNPMIYTIGYDASNVTTCETGL
jgi:hypothetical protein